MSILIKGVDLPEAYTSAWLTVFECVGEHKFMKTHKVSAEQIQAIPPHGPLVDAEALQEWSEIVPLTDDGGIDINDFDEKLVSMPTIIEAEEGEAMTDYIDRQAAIAYAISGRIRTLPTSEDGENWIRTAEVRQSLLDVPSAEAEPVKHGRWEFEAKWQYKNCDGRGMERKEIFGTTKRTCHRLKCSKCKKAVVIDDTIAYAYCPHCGAKMDLEGEAHEVN